MHSWQDNWYDTSGQKLSNAAEMIKITDPKNNFVFEVHQYLDSDFGGSYTNGECLSATIGSEKAKPFVAWLRANNRKAILAEVGTPNTALCSKSVNDFLTYINANSDVMVGWLWWNAIRDNFWGNYSLDLTPKNGVDDPRINWIAPFLASSATPPPAPAPSPTPSPSPTTTTTVIPTSTTTAPTCCPCTPSVPTLTARAAAYTTWSNGYCSNIYITNSDKVSQVWHHVQVSMQDGSMRDYWNFKTTSQWGAKGNVTFTPGTITTLSAGKETVVGGFCADGSPTKPATIVSVD
jgi:hypothetical protein